MNNPSPLRIGQLARRCKVGVETLRFYEREGLLPAPPRTDSGYRLYPADSVSRLEFILRAKELGFTLSEIRELLRLQDGGGRAEVKSLAAHRLQDIRQRIADLQRMEQVLANLHAACSGRGSTAGCPIIDAIAAPQGSVQRE